MLCTVGHALYVHALTTGRNVFSFVLFLFSSCYKLEWKTIIDSTQVSLFNVGFAMLSDERVLFIVREVWHY